MHRIFSYVTEIHLGSPEHLLLFFSGANFFFKTFQKIPKKIMHVPDHGTHHRVKFRPEMTSYAPCAKITNILSEMRSKNSNLRSGNMSFLHKAHTMSFRGKISHGGAYHGQVRAWFFSEFFEKFWNIFCVTKKKGSYELGIKRGFPVIVPCWNSKICYCSMLKF